MLRIVPVDAPVDVTVRVQFTDALPAGSSHPPHSLIVSNPFTRVFGYGTVFWKANGGETTEAVEWRLLDRQAARQLLPARWGVVLAPLADDL